MSQEAQKVLINPLIEPDPSDDTGLNSHFRSTYAPRTNSSISQTQDYGLPKQNTGSSTMSSNNPYRNRTSSRASSRTSRGSYPSPPQSASPRKTQFPAFNNSHRGEAFAAYADEPRRSSSSHKKSPSGASETRSRGSSLGERFPGDTSHRPLETIRKDSKRAHRSPHLRKKHIPGADTIDRLDASALRSYHHEGPYDAALLARNTSWESSPIAAVQRTNEEALKATPRENILNSLERHKPLEGTAVVPPGIPDAFGRVYNYEEGADLMRENGANYKRWPDMEYLPDDLKGKGEPSYSIEKALKDHKTYGEPEGRYTDNPQGIEMQTRRRNKSQSYVDDVPVTDSSGVQSGTVRSNSAGGTGRKVSGTLRKRIGSLRRKGKV